MEPKMRILLLTPVLLLSACNPAAQQPKPTEDVADATSSATASSAVKYTCNNGKSVTAVYKEDEQKSANDGAPTEFKSSTVTLTIDGKPYTLDSAVSASGARYSGKVGPTKDSFFTWWEKDLEAEDIVARCKEASGK
jgi:membrane-bound inhibitor of C-type lysozyme